MTSLHNLVFSDCDGDVIISEWTAHRNRIDTRSILQITRVFISPGISLHLFPPSSLKKTLISTGVWFKRPGQRSCFKNNRSPGKCAQNLLFKLIHSCNQPFLWDLQLRVSFLFAGEGGEANTSFSLHDICNSIVLPSICSVFMLYSGIVHDHLCNSRRDKFLFKLATRCSSSFPVAVHFGVQSTWFSILLVGSLRRATKSTTRDCSTVVTL